MVRIVLKDIDQDDLNDQEVENSVDVKMKDWMMFFHIQEQGLDGEQKIIQRLPMRYIHHLVEGHS